MDLAVSEHHSLMGMQCFQLLADVAGAAAKLGCRYMTTPGSVHRTGAAA